VFQTPLFAQILACAGFACTGLTLARPALARLAAIAVARPAADGPHGAAAAPRSPLVVTRGPDALAFEIPAAEVLDFDVFVELGLLGKLGKFRVGSFELSSGVEPFQAGLPPAGIVTAALASEPVASFAPVPRAGWMRGRARGRYLGFVLDHTIETRVLPQAWPRFVHRDTAAGSACRRRELRYGDRDGVNSLWYRSDTHCKGCERREHFVDASLFSPAGHCRRCRRSAHRVWKAPRTRTIPTGAVDMLSAVFLCRAMVAEGRDELTFPLLDKDTIWELGVKRAGRQRIETSAGTFTCRAIVLSPRAAEGEPRGGKAQFKGLFGIHGTLSIWVEEASGIPVRIEGTVPVGPLDLVVSLELRSTESP